MLHKKGLNCWRQRAYTNSDTDQAIHSDLNPMTKIKMREPSNSRSLWFSLQSWLIKVWSKTSPFLLRQKTLSTLNPRRMIRDSRWTSQPTPWLRRWKMTTRICISRSFHMSWVFSTNAYRTPRLTKRMKVSSSLCKLSRNSSPTCQMTKKSSKKGTKSNNRGRIKNWLRKKSRGPKQ